MVDCVDGRFLRLRVYIIGSLCGDRVMNEAPNVSNLEDKEILSNNYEYI